jgi:exonuclease SbcD
MREGIAQTYQHLSREAAIRYPGATILAMGHLFAAGSTISDSEREIQIGNLAAVGTDAFPRNLKYVALGHLHRPQEVGGNSRIRYSGSPISLSFSEHEDRKEIVRIDTEERIVYVKPVQIPTFRTLIRASGSLQELEAAFRPVLPSIYRLPAWAEAELVLEKSNPIEISAFEQWVNQFQHQHLQIIRHRVKLKNEEQNLRWTEDPGMRLEDLQPIDVFRKRLDQTSLSVEDRLALEQTFRDLLQETLEDEE